MTVLDQQLSHYGCGHLVCALRRSFAERIPSAAGRIGGSLRRRISGWTRRLTDADAVGQRQARAADGLSSTTPMQMIGLLTNSITHEIKQPLAAVATNTDAALRWLDHEPANLDEARSALGRISRDSWRAAEVLQAIGDLFAGTARELVPLDIGQLVRDCLAIVDDELRDHRISLTCTLSPSLPQVRGDRVQLQQCVVNLILNAVEAMQREPNRPRKLIIDASVEDDGYVTLKLTDSGPGVDPMIADRLFDTFFTTKPHGKGIGLSICRSIVEAHGGRITAAPACKFGASFHMHLPTATARAT